MARFWNARAREDAYYFVDNDGKYRDVDLERFWAGGEEVIARLFETLEIDGVGPADTVVDIGCGVGRLTRVLAARAGHVHAVDVSPEMVARARALLGEPENVTWHVGDGTSLRPLADESVDAVVSHVVFQHIPDPAITLGYVREIGRVLRPGGWSAFQVSTDPGVHERRYRSPSLLKRLLGRAPRGQADPSWLGSAIDLGDLRSNAQRAGMVVDRVVGEGTQFCLVRVAKR